MKHFWFLIVLCVASCVLCVDVWAVPAKPGIITLKQPDGSVLKVRLRGDENYHYYETLDGERIESTVDGRRSIVNTQQNIAGESYNSKKRIHPAIKNPHFSLSASQSLFHVSHSQRAPHQAERGLVILVEFADVSFVKTKQNFDDLLHKEGYNYNGATGSARDYFRDASNGQYVPRFDLYGPYKLPQTMAYYGQNDYQGLDLHPDQMVVDAVAMLVADATANVNIADYDTDNDGNIDNIFIYYAGYGENEGAHENTIWPHAWEVYQSNVTGQLVYNGKCIKGYACTSELQGSSGSTICGIGTFCHEFSHVLGLPDFYVTDYSSNHKTPGDWDVMDNGPYLNNGNTPPTYSAHERFYLGWLTPEILNADGNYVLPELQSSNKAYIVTASGSSNLDGGNPNPAIYYLLENRQKVGWDKYLPGHGMMLSRTMYDEDKWYNNVPNDIPGQLGYDIIEADGKAPNNNQGKPGDLFPGTDNVTQKTLYSIYHLSNIAETDGVISFKLASDADVDVDVTDDCFYETFDSLTAESSIDITEDIDMYADHLGWEGYKLFCSAGQLKVGSSKYAGYVITPELGIEGDVRVEFSGSGYNAEATILFELDGEVVEQRNVGSTIASYSFDLKDLLPTSRIKISADINRFYIDNFKVCRLGKTTATDALPADDIFIVNNGARCQLVGVSAGAEVRCYDAMGRLLWQSIADADSLEFDAPRGFYILQVTNADAVSVVKSVGN